MKIKYLGIFLVATIFFTSCILGVGEEDFSLKVKVIDENGDGVNGLNVHFFNKLDDVWEQSNFGNYPGITSIPFRLGTTSSVKIKISDIRNNEVKELVNDELEAGFHSASWNGKDAEGNSLPAGVYYCKMEVEYDGDTYIGKRVMYLLSRIPDRKNGVTDSEGIYSSNDKSPFINLFNIDTIPSLSEQGDENDPLNISDKTMFYLYDEENESFQISEYTIKSGENNIDIIWNPQPANRSYIKPFNVTRGVDDEIVPNETELLKNYPNPF